jgi:hypothetical protein
VKNVVNFYIYARRAPILASKESLRSMGLVKFLSPRKHITSELQISSFR